MAFADELVLEVFVGDLVYAVFEYDPVYLYGLVLVAFLNV